MVASVVSFVAKAVEDAASSLVQVVTSLSVVFMYDRYDTARSQVHCRV